MNKNKFPLLLLCLTAAASIPQNSYGIWGIGSEIKRWGRKADPSPLYKKTVEEIERIDDNVERYVKNPSDAFRSYVDLINPIKALEETSRGLQKFTGGELRRFANKVQTETGRINDDLDVMIEGSSDAFQQALTHPKQGVPRLASCSFTLCASELVQYKRIEEIRRQKHAEYNQKLQALQVEQSRGLRNIVEQRILELQDDLKDTQRQIEITQDSLAFGAFLENRMRAAPTMDSESLEVSRALSTPEVKKMGIELIDLMSRIYQTQGDLSEEQVNRYKELENQLTLVALSAEIHFDVLIASIADSMALDRKSASKHLKTAAALKTNALKTLQRLQREATNTELEIQHELARLESLKA